MNRKGHGYGGLALLPVFLVGLLVGWPVVLPVFSLMDWLGFNTSDDINMLVLGATAPIGAFVQYRAFRAIYRKVMRRWHSE